MTALTFPTNLYDGNGYLWDIAGGGSIWNGTADAYDIGLSNHNFPPSWSARPEDDGREIVFEAAAVNGIQLTRKIYVPEDSGWARFLEIVTNTKSTTITYSLNLNTNLGSDGSTVLVGTSTGDSALDRNDRWIGVDRIDVRAFDFADFATLAANIEDLAGDTLVRFGEDSVLLMGVSAQAVGEADFLIAWT